MGTRARSVEDKTSSSSRNGNEEQIKVFSFLFLCDKHEKKISEYFFSGFVTQYDLSLFLRREREKEKKKKTLKICLNEKCMTTENDV